LLFPPFSNGNNDSTWQKSFSRLEFFPELPNSQVSGDPKAKALESAGRVARYFEPTVPKNINIPSCHFKNIHNKASQNKPKLVFFV
jgi:hypothetical protein